LKGLFSDSVTGLIGLIRKVILGFAHLPAGYRFTKGLTQDSNLLTNLKL